MTKSQLATAVALLSAVVSAVATSPQIALIDPTVGLVLMVAATALAALNEALGAKKDANEEPVQKDQE